jgi:hypothetical protein
VAIYDDDDQYRRRRKLYLRKNEGNLFEVQREIYFCSAQSDTYATAADGTDEYQ